VIRLPALALLAIATLPAAGTARTGAAPAMAVEMEGSARQSLLARCGGDPRCAAFGRRDGAEPRITISGLTCRQARRHGARIRRCDFTAQSAARSDRLSCSAEFHQGQGATATFWSDRRLVKQPRVYLPTSRIDAPVTLGASTLSCSGSVIDYVS